MPETEQEKLPPYVLARAARTFGVKRRKFLESLSPANRNEFYHRVYQRLDRDALEQKLKPLFQPGIDKVIFYNVPMTVNRIGTPGAFDTTLGELIRRIHLACETEMTEAVMAEMKNGD